MMLVVIADTAAATTAVTAVCTMKLLDFNSVQRSERPLRSADLALKGQLFDVDGHPMSPSFGYGRGGKVYRYYVSAPLQQGRKMPSDGRAIRRIKAEAVEAALRDQLIPLVGREPNAPLQQLLAPVRRVILTAEELTTELNLEGLPRAAREKLTTRGDGVGVIVTPVRCQTRGVRASVVLPVGAPPARVRRDPVLIEALRKAHRIASGIGWKSADGSLASCQVEAPKNA